MKTKITIKNFLTNAMIALIMLFGFGAKAQTYVYNESISSGAWYQSSDGGEVANPISDGVNSSATCGQNGTDGTWQQIQYFPTYTPVSGDKLYFSIYNPNNTGPGQVQFRYTSNQSSWQFGGNVSYTTESQTGWVEYSVDLTAHVGNEIDQVIIMPSGDNSAATYVDNIYFNDASVLGGGSGGGTIVIYDETTKSGMWYQSSDGGEVANPISDGVNSSATCGQNGTDGTWQQIQYFPTFTPVNGDKLHFSIYNPNNTGPGQVQFRYTSNQSSWQFGGNVSYTAESQTGWVEYSVDLSDHAGNQIDQVIIMPSGDNSAATYVDNIYVAQSSTLSANSVTQINNRIFVTKEGIIQFEKVQTNTLLSVYDLTGRLILEEKITGKRGDKVLINNGIYILRAKSDKGVSTQKIAFY